MRRVQRRNTPCEEWKPVKIDNKKELTIIDAIEQVVILVKDSSFCPAFYRAAKRPLEYLAEQLSLTKEQAALFSIFVNFSNDNRILISEIAEFVNCTHIEMLRRATDFEALKECRYIARSGSNVHGETYAVAPVAIKVVKENRPLEPIRIENLSIDQFFDQLHLYIKDRKDEHCEYDEMYRNISALLDGNKHLLFVEKLKSLNLDTESQLAFLQACNMLINNQDMVVTLDDITFLYERPYVARSLFTQLNSEEHPLIELGLLQSFGKVMARKDAFELGSVALKDILSEMKLAPKESNTKNLLDHKTICARQLFYNPSEEIQIAQLEALLQPARFERVCDRLSEKGMRRGFACLFYGAPGTGKTETVLQLARNTWRDIIQVNISELRDKYVGESEKRVKTLFDRYRKVVAEEDIAPILLFNEADGIISKRSENIAHSVDKMENAMQNIILQEIENLEGILIATTNLTANLDKAFERRFLYKIEFKVPSIEAKRAIWQSMLPILTGEEATILANTYNFSGGQIENIARKYTVAQILSEGDDIPFENIRAMCNEELLDKSQSRRAIGF